ncbi:MAG: hypothetical protein Q4A00_06025 [Flavobacteriaceae bacterium]|nr:hypothetical protein [Flavobacteriaceae bacterium]
MKKKKKLLIINPLFPEIFIQETRKYVGGDFEVIHFSPSYSEIESSIISKLWHKIANIFYRVVLKDKKYFYKKEIKQQQLFQERELKKLSSQFFDIIFFTRADRFSLKFVEMARKMTGKLINYQCDGIEMCQNIKKMHHLFDYLYTFEKRDIVSYPNIKFIPTTNFYFDIDKSELPNIKYDFHYLGVGLEDRISVLQRVIKKIKGGVQAELLRFTS